MIFSVAPHQLVMTHLGELGSQLPLLRNADERAIHDARVAIRRLKEPLALVRIDFDDGRLEAFDRRVGRLFKALGRARDADIAQRLIHHVAIRCPLAPSAISRLRAVFAREQMLARRKLLKVMEAVEPHTFADAIHASLQRHGWRMPARLSWRPHLLAHVRHRGEELLSALERAGGVYFRNRSHGARIAMKRFRYALELAAALGAPGGCDVRSLRKGQDALGQAHDRDVLLQRLEALLEDDDEKLVPKDEAALLDQFLSAEIAEYHQKFLAVRGSVLDLTTEVLRPRRRLPAGAGAAAAAAAIALVITGATGTLARR